MTAESPSRMQEIRDFIYDAMVAALKDLFIVWCRHNFFRCIKAQKVGIYNEIQIIWKLSQMRIWVKFLETQRDTAAYPLPLELKLYYECHLKI